MHVAALESWRPTNLSSRFEHIQMFYIRTFFLLNWHGSLKKKQNKNTTYRAAWQYMPHLQTPCNAALALVSSPDPAPEDAFFVRAGDEKLTSNE